MSYIRSGSKLKWFNGFSKSYVFPSVGDFVEDYDDKFEDDKTFIEVIGKIILRETQDEKWTLKVVRLMAKKMNIPESEWENLTTEEQIEQTFKAFNKRTRGGHDGWE